MEEGEERERPTVGIVGYGSLLSPDELAPFLDTDAARVVPVRVDGFRRTFNQESVWRVRASDGDEDERAVLNAVRDDEASMNAVLVPDLSSGEYEALRARESGYRMVEVEDGDIEPYGADAEDALPETAGCGVVLISTGNRVDESIRPIPEYVETCLKGARCWGDGFRDDFLRTTEVSPGETLAEYLDKGFDGI